MWYLSALAFCEDLQETRMVMLVGPTPTATKGILARPAVISLHGFIQDYPLPCCDSPCPHHPHPLYAAPSCMFSPNVLQHCMEAGGCQGVKSHIPTAVSTSALDKGKQ